VRRGRIFDGLDRGEDESFPDAVSAQIAEAWRASAFKALEVEFAAQVAGGQKWERTRPDSVRRPIDGPAPWGVGRRVQPKGDVKTMPKAVRYDGFGGIDVLRVDEVERPVPGDGQVLVRVKAAGINPSEAAIRTGAVREIFPSTFPSGQGSDLAGVIEEVGAGVEGFAPGDEVIGFSNKRASQAELVLVEVGDLTRKPENISWEVAGSLYVVGVTAWGAVHSVEPKEGETVVISGAAGGVGSLAVQLARRTGATVIGLASGSNHEWLKSHGVIPVEYGDGVTDRIKAAAPGGVDAFIDTHGNGYVELALALGIPAERIDTIADFAAAAKHGVKTAGGAAAGPGAKVLAELAALIADGQLEVPIANVYPLAQVREAYTELERRHTRGKIVLRP
jgi:NADPH:quinone reductase-like Zn-dependent oxidoreductase